MAKKVTVLIFVVIAVGLAVYFSGRGARVVDYNNRLNASLMAFVRATNDVEAEIKIWLQEKNLDSADFENKVKMTEAKYNALQTDLKTIPVPSHESCRNYHQALQAYVDLLGEKLPLYQKILSEVKKPEPASVPFQMEIVESLTKIQKRGKKKVVTLKEARDKMAETFGLKQEAKSL